MKLETALRVAHRTAHTHDERKTKTHLTTFLVQKKIEEAKLIGRQNCWNIISTIDSNFESSEI